MKRIWFCMLCALVLMLSCACRETVPQESTDKETTVTVTTTTATKNTTTTSTTKQYTTARPTLKVTTVLKTTAVTTVSDTVQLPLWKQLYMLTAKAESNTYDAFVLLDIDDDNIPEMFMRGEDGCAMRSYRENGIGDGKESVIQQKLNKGDGVYYIPKSGRFMNVYADGDHLTVKVYELTATRGFIEVFTGYEYTCEMPDTATEKVYYIGGSVEPLDKAAFDVAVDAVFKNSSAVSLENKVLSLEKFNEQVRTW